MSASAVVSRGPATQRRPSARTVVARCGETMTPTTWVTARRARGSRLAGTNRARVGYWL